jgi:hypothetical protein
MKRFWFTFRNTERSAPVGPGCGVSAHDYSDAVGILEETVLRDYPTLIIEGVREDVDVRDLDQGHVVPNIGNVAVRGVWFPKGYDPNFRC